MILTHENMDGMVDIEITLIEGRKFLSPHTSRRNPSYYLSLKVNGNERRTGRGGKASQALIWDQKFAFAVNLDSTLHIEVFCIHGSARRDHEIGQADINMLAVERNKDVEIPFHRKADRSEEKVTAGYITLRLRVAFLATFVVQESKEDVYLNPSSISFEIDRIKVQQLSPIWKDLLRSLGKVASYAENIAGLDSRAALAIKAVTFVIHAKRDEKVERLGGIMADVYSYLYDVIEMDTILSYQKTLDKLFWQTTECLHFISEYETVQNFVQKAALHVVSNADNMIAQFEASFGELKISLILGTSLQTAIVSYRILQKVENIEVLLYLNKLPYLDAVGWDSGRTCLRGTRQHWIDEILNWASSSSGVDQTCPRRIYVLAGPPGCGKSTIAHTVAQAFHQQGRLAASLFLRNHPGSRFNSQTVSSTIVYQLANYDPAIMDRVARALKSDTSLATADIGRQFPRLLVGTINPGTTKDRGALAMIGPALIILDDLQEIRDIREQNRIVTAIADYFINLPPNIRLLLTSQQEGVITTVLGRLPQHCGIHQITFDNPRGEAPDKFMTSSLEHLASKVPEMNGKDNLANLCQSLMERSMGVPTWTHTLFGFLSFCDGHRDSFPGMWHILQQILSSPFPLSKEDAMDNLYRIILSSLPYPAYLVKELLLSFIQSAGGLSLVNAHRSTLPLCTHYDAFGKEISNCPILQTMQALGLLVGKGKAENESLFTLRADFRDFLTSERRCHGTMFSVEPEEACRVAVERIKLMNEKFGLYYYHHETSEASSITSSRSYTKDSLHYACLTWIFYLESCGVNCLTLPDDYSLLLTTLEEFVADNIFDWMQYLGNRQHRMEPRELQLSFLRRLERWAKHHLSSASITTFKSRLHRMHKDLCTIISSEPMLLQEGHQEWKDLDTLISLYQFALRHYAYTQQQDNDMRKKSWILHSHDLATALFKRYKLVRNKSRLQQWRLLISDMKLPEPCLRDLKTANEVEHGAKGLLRYLGAVKVTRLELDETYEQVQQLADVLMSHVAAANCR